MKKITCFLSLSMILLASCAGDTDDSGATISGSETTVTATTGTETSTTPITEAEGSDDSTSSVPKTPSEVPEFDGSHVSPAEFAAAINNGAMVLDVGTADEYRESHIPGAVLLDVTADDFDALAGHLNKSRNYAVYCRSDDSRSEEAIERLREAGIDSAVGLDGGISAWEGDVTGEKS
ncbi:rhodanese-like domain-containing protein [Corynebacterium sp. CCM 9204]|uniref:rhodanese-like domain-containing protein n=1 Tax=Corynebacterium sp. CCM 9204 TaxID=3057616 RepID=UPI0035262F34